MYNDIDYHHKGCHPGDLIKSLYFKLLNFNATVLKAKLGVFSFKMFGHVSDISFMTKMSYQPNEISVFIIYPSCISVLIIISLNIP